MVGNPDYFPVRFFLSRHCLPCVLGENTTDTIKLQYRQEKCLLAIVTKHLFIHIFEHSDSVKVKVKPQYVQLTVLTLQSIRKQLYS